MGCKMIAGRGLARLESSSNKGHEIMLTDASFLHPRLGSGFDM